jgi:hypothetical protein
MTTPEQERDRMAGVYSGMSDEELGVIAQSSSELTTVAREALISEMTRRGMEIAVTDPDGFDVPELNKTVALRRYRDLPEALLAKGGLESAGIKAYLVDDNIVRMDWFYSNLIGGIKLVVNPEDAEAATEILNQPIPETIEVEGVGSYEQPKCPKCQSLDVNFQELNKFFSYGSAGVGIPVPVYKKAWTCHSCGNEWEEAELEIKS